MLRGLFPAEANPAGALPAADANDGIFRCLREPSVLAEALKIVRQHNWFNVTLHDLKNGSFCQKKLFLTVGEFAVKNNWCNLKGRALADALVQEPLCWKRHLRVKQLDTVAQPLADHVKRDYILEDNLVKQAFSPFCDIISAYALDLNNPLIILLV